MANTAYTKFRFVNKDKPNHFCCSGVELYGILMGPDKLQIPIVDNVREKGVRGEKNSSDWCKPGFRLTWQDSQQYAQKIGGRLLTLSEARGLLQAHGPL